MERLNAANISLPKTHSLELEAATGTGLERRDEGRSFTY